MILIHEPDKWWKGLYVACQSCGRVWKMEGTSTEVQLKEAGDMKEEATLSWECQKCKRETVTSYSRMMEDTGPLQIKYGKTPHPVTAGY